MVDYFSNDTHKTFTLEINCLYDRAIGLMSRVFTNGPRDLGSIPGRVIPKTQKMVLDAALLNPQHYKFKIKGKVEYSGNVVAPYPTFGVVAIEKGAFGSLLAKVANFTYTRKKLFITEFYSYL